MKPVKIGLLGLGTVGTGVVKIIEGHQEDLQRQVGCPITIERVLVKHIEKDRGVQVDPAIMTTNPQDVLENPEIDVVVEVMGGTGRRGIIFWLLSKEENMWSQRIKI